jgi:acetyl-CoA acetyltransferase
LALLKLTSSFFNLQAVLDNTRIVPVEIGDIVVGTLLAPGAQRANECRMAAFYAGIPGNSFFLSFVAIIEVSYKLIKGGSNFIHLLVHVETVPVRTVC